MKLAIFGATGRTGIPLVEQALAQGHHVTALVRDPKDMEQEYPNLTVIKGNILEADDVEKAVTEAQAVLTVIGHVKGSPEHLQTDGTRNIVAAMKKHDIRRIISLTGGSVSAPDDDPSVLEKMVYPLVRHVIPAAWKDAYDHADVLEESGLEWTIVRAPLLLDGPHTGDYHVGNMGDDSSFKVSRENVADFMLKVLAEGSYVREMPMVSE